jgi:hypothetical protein
MWIQKSSALGGAVVNAERFDEIAILDQPGGLNGVIMRSGTTTEFIHRGTPEECNQILSAILVALEQGYGAFSVAAQGL